MILHVGSGEDTVARTLSFTSDWSQALQPVEKETHQYVSRALTMPIVLTYAQERSVEEYAPTRCIFLWAVGFQVNFISFCFHIPLCLLSFTQWTCITFREKTKCKNNIWLKVLHHWHAFYTHVLLTISSPSFQLCLFGLISHVPPDITVHRSQ